MYKLVVLTGLIVATVTHCLVFAQQDRDKELTKERFMQRKLLYTNEIVAGIATENFNQIAKGSQDLILLSNESNWNAVNTSAYIKASRDFRETVERVRAAGKEKNLDAATLGFFEVTLNCIRCHKQLK